MEWFYPWRLLRVTAGAGHRLEGAGVRVRDRYKNATQLEFESGNNEEYKVDGIQDSTIHAKESEHETEWSTLKNPTATYQGSASPMQLQLNPST